MRTLATYESGKGKTFDLTETLEKQNKELRTALTELLEQCEWIPKKTFTKTGLTRFKEVIEQGSKAMGTKKPSKHKYILIELEERNGEQEYRQHMTKKLELDANVDEVADYVARTWYEEGEGAEESEGGYYHLDGCIFVRVESITEITEQEFNTLKKFSL